MIIKRFPILLTLACLLLSACNLPASSSASSSTAGPAAWIDFPRDNTTLPLAPLRFVAHGYDAGGVTQFELSVNGSVVNTAPPTGADDKLFRVDENWTPPANGVYTLVLRALGASGGWSEPVSVVVNISPVVNSVAVAATLPLESPVPSLTPTLTPYLSPTVGVPMAVGLENTNCHRGAGVSFINDGTLFTGASVKIVGINAGRSWVLVENPQIKGNLCWLSLPVIQVSGDLSQVKVVASPPTPVPTNKPRPTAPPAQPQAPTATAPGQVPAPTATPSDGNIHPTLSP